MFFNYMYIYSIFCFNFVMKKIRRKSAFAFRCLCVESIVSKSIISSIYSHLLLLVQSGFVFDLMVNPEDQFSCKIHL